MSFLIVTIPVSLLVAACLLALVLWAVAGGAFDDWDAPARHMLWDDDGDPELDRVSVLPSEEERDTLGPIPDDEPHR